MGNLVERILFPSPVPSYNLSSFPGELILIPQKDGQRVPCIFLPFHYSRYLVIFFHANAEDLGTCHMFCTVFRDLCQAHILAVEYPGYGICHGKTDEAGIMAHAEAAMLFVMDTLGWSADNIIIFGRSIGTAPAVALARRYEVAGLILVSPFTSILELLRSQVGQLAELISSTRFDNLQCVHEIRSPTLIIHGLKDTLIPVEHGQRMHVAMRCKRMLVCPEGMGHNTSLLRDVNTFVLPITQFFSLPDYIFEDVQVPVSVFPSAFMQARGGTRAVHHVSAPELASEASSRSQGPRTSRKAEVMDCQGSLSHFPIPLGSDDEVPDTGGGPPALPKPRQVTFL